MSAHPVSLIREKPGVLERFIDWLATTDPERVAAYVEKLRSENPGITNDDLARKIVTRKAHRNGLVGAAAGIPGFLFLPLSVPADLTASCRIQIDMTVCVAYVYGFTYDKAVLKTDTYLILAGNVAKHALESLGIGLAKLATKQAIEKFGFIKFVPLVGAPLGYAFDWAAAQAAGRMAIRYYSGSDRQPRDCAEA